MLIGYAPTVTKYTGAPKIPHKRRLLSIPTMQDATTETQRKQRSQAKILYEANMKDPNFNIPKNGKLVSTPRSEPYLTCALASASKLGDTPELMFIQQGDSVISSRTAYRHSLLEDEFSFQERKIKRVVYNDEHISWFGCSHHGSHCCHRDTADYPMSCRNVRDDELWLTQAPCCTRHYLRVFFYITQLFESVGIQYAVSFGAAITAVRTGDYNPFDYDIDINVFPDQLPVSRELLQ